LAQLRVTVTNLGAPITATMNVSIRKNDLQLIPIVNATRHLQKFQNFQEDWQFVGGDTSLGSSIPTFASTNSFYYSGSYFSEAGNLILVCDVKLQSIQSEERSMEWCYPSTQKLLADSFSDANVDPEEVPELTDIILRVGNSKIYCSKFVLSLTSNFFKRMFSSDMKESRCYEIELNGVNLKTMKSVISFMYKDEIEDDKIDVDLLAAADMYQVMNLKNICSQRLSKCLNASNVIEIWHAAYLYNDESLALNSILFMTKNWEALVEQDDIRELGKRDPDLLFTISSLLVRGTAGRKLKREL